MSLNIYDAANNKLNKVGLEQREKEEPWQPLNDGYSNFWFELTDDTLSPWLRFSQKTSNAVIDWGDGSGEQALTTLTPTHTYSKAGRYVVKVKGVTGIDRQHLLPRTDYTMVLKYVELNNDVTELVNYAFADCGKLEIIDLSSCENLSMGQYLFYCCASLERILGYSGTVTSYMLYLCSNLKSYTFGNDATSVGSTSFYFCNRLTSITLPSTILSLGANAFRLCESLSEIHVQATTPPTVQSTTFTSIYSQYVIYVPVGTLSAYQTAWRTYADHIVEEGQQPNRMMLAKLGSAGLGEEDEEMR